MRWRCPTWTSEAAGGAGELILYTAEDGSIAVQLRADSGTVWLSQAEMAALFQTTPQNITQHIKAVYAEGELQPEATVRKAYKFARKGAARSAAH